VFAFKTNEFFAGFKASMEQQIRSLVSDWYGLENMPMRVQTREEEVAEYESIHTEVPPCLWGYVNHTLRHVRMWSKVELCVDIVVEDMAGVRLIQDVVFKDAFPTAAAWHQAVYAYLAMNPAQRVWIVTHAD
jgi:hypothetical protein